MKQLTGSNQKGDKSGRLYTNPRITGRFQSIRKDSIQMRNSVPRASDPAPAHMLVSFHSILEAADCIDV